MSPRDAIDVAEQIAVSQFSGYVLLMVVAGLMLIVMRVMWEMIKKQIADVRSMLTTCQEGHKECERASRALALAVLDQSEGKRWEAKAKAEAVLSERPTPEFQPGAHQ